MKKEKHSSKKSKNMATTVPKRMQSFISAIGDFVSKIIEQVSEDEEYVTAFREEFDNNQESLLSIIKANMPSQKSDTVKKVKDPDAPKRGKSSYIFFCVDMREKIKKSNPNMDAKDIIKELGRVWREDISEKDKAKYTKLSEQDKKRYEEEMKDYTPPPNVGNVINTKKTKRKGPKRGLTSYIFFCKEHRDILKKNDPNLSTKDITSELGKKWRSLSEKERSPYNKLAAQDKIRYEQEKENWVDPDESDEPAPKKTKKTKGTKATKATKATKTTKAKKATKASSKKQVKETKAKPQVRRKSGYVFFCQEERPKLKAQHSDWSGQQISKELGQLWKALSEEDQAEYNERAAENVGKTVTKPKAVKTVKAGKAIKAVEIESDLDDSDIENSE